MKQVLKFKTNLDCQNCVSKVKPFLDKVSGVKSWNVDTDNPNKVLSVEYDGSSPQDIMDAVDSVGFDIEKL